MWYIYYHKTRPSASHYLCGCKPVWQTCATKCDVHVTIWLEAAAAADDVRRWARWWALDGPDDTHCLRGLDTKGDLNKKSLDVRFDGDVWHLGHPNPSKCALTGDGKAMLFCQLPQGEVLRRLQVHSCLECASSAPSQCRWGSFLRAIGPCNRVGDVEHSSCRVAKIIVKRLNESIERFIKTGASDLARAAREARKALVLELHRTFDEVKNVPHA